MRSSLGRVHTKIKECSQYSCHCPNSLCFSSMGGGGETEQLTTSKPSLETAFKMPTHCV